MNIFTIRSCAFLVIIEFFLLPVFAVARIHGRIHGKVTDKETGDALPGVTIRLTHSAISAVSNAAGEFTMIGVPAGAYDISAENEGYRKKTYKGFQVYPDMMNEIAFALSSHSAGAEDEILPAQNPSYQPNDPYLRRFISAEDIGRQPHRSLNDIIQQAAGDVYQRAISPTLPLGERYIRTDELFYRGGAAREAGYYMNGLRLNDANSGGTHLTLPYGAIELVTLQTGGYEAKYGQLGTGMTHIVPKRGGKTFSGSAELVAGEYERNVYSITVGGPLLDDRTRFFAALDYTALEDAEPGVFGHPLVRYSTAGIKNPDPSLNDTAMFATDRSGKLKYKHGARPERVNASDLTNLYVGLSYEPSAVMLFDLTTLFSSIKKNQFSSSYLLSPHGVPREERSSYLVDLTGKYVLSSDMYLQAHIGWYSSDDKIAARSFFDMGDRAIGILNSETRGNTRSNTYYGDNLLSDIDREFVNYKQSESDVWLGGLNFNWQWNKEHLIESGFEFTSHTERMLDMTDIGSPILGANNVYGYRIEYNDFYILNVTHQNKDEGTGFFLLDGPKKPLTVAFFAQDKYSIDKFTFSGGLRADYFSTRMKTVKVENDYWWPTRYLKLNENKSFVKWSPRLGISTELNKNVNIHANYGWFYHLPAFENYLVSSHMVQKMLIAPPFANYTPNPILEPEKTEAIEFGLFYHAARVSFDATFFRNSVSDVIVKGLKPDSPNSLWTLDNSGPTVVAGFNFHFEDRITDNFTTGAFATFLRSSTSASESSTGFRSDWLLEGQTQIEAPSDHEQRTTIKLFADARLLKGEGPLTGDIRPLQNTNFFVWINWASGFPYTPYPVARYIYAGTSTTAPIDDRNSRTTPPTMTVDVKITKQFDVSGRYHATVYLEIWNLLNRKNPVQVFSATGQADSDGYLGTPAAQTLSTRQRQQYEYVMKDNLHYSNPRWINVGCKVEF